MPPVMLFITRTSYLHEIVGKDLQTFHGMLFLLLLLSHKLHMVKTYVLNLSLDLYHYHLTIVLNNAGETQNSHNDNNLKIICNN